MAELIISLPSLRVQQCQSFPNVVADVPHGMWRIGKGIWHDPPEYKGSCQMLLAGFQVATVLLTSTSSSGGTAATMKSTTTVTITTTTTWKGDVVSQGQNRDMYLP